MRDRNLMTGVVSAVIAAVCCATPVVVATVGAVGLTAWFAKAGNVLIPALTICVGLIGFGLVRSNVANGRGMDDYDLIVIGTGTAAQVAATHVRRAGRSVAVIDHRPFGGTCALCGCDPKKMLVSGAEAADWARRMRRHGVVGELRINWKELIAFKRTFTDPYRRSASRVSPNRASMPFTGWLASVARTPS